MRSTSLFVILLSVSLHPLCSSTQYPDVQRADTNGFITIFGHPHYSSGLSLVACSEPNTGRYDEFCRPNLQGERLTNVYAEFIEDGSVGFKYPTVFANQSFDLSLSAVGIDGSLDYLLTYEFHVVGENTNDFFGGDLGYPAWITPEPTTLPQTEEPVTITQPPHREPELEVLISENEDGHLVVANDPEYRSELMIVACSQPIEDVFDEHCSPIMEENQKLTDIKDSFSYSTGGRILENFLAGRNKTINLNIYGIDGSVSNVLTYEFKTIIPTDGGDIYEYTRGEIVYEAWIIQTSTEEPTETQHSETQEPETQEPETQHSEPPAETTVHTDRIENNEDACTRGLVIEEEVTYIGVATTTLEPHSSSGIVCGSSMDDRWVIVYWTNFNGDINCESVESSEMDVVKCDEVEITETSPSQTEARTCLPEGLKAGCNKDSHSGAENLCHNAGGRLCTKDELHADITAEMGCGFDHELIWSATTCGDNNESFLAEYGQQLDARGNAECLPDHGATKLAVRCCQDVECPDTL